MISQITDTTQLKIGIRMPWLGLGVWRVSEGGEVVSSVKHAIAAGYRSIDTAAIYGNEAGVGQAIRESGAARDDLFITTKLWNEAQGYDSTLAAFEESRRKLGLDYLDLYLITGRSPRRVNIRIHGRRSRSCIRTAWSVRLA